MVEKVDVLLNKFRPIISADSLSFKKGHVHYSPWKFVCSSSDLTENQSVGMDGNSSTRFPG